MNKARLDNLHIYPSNFTHETRMLKETKSIAAIDGVTNIKIGAIWNDGLAEHEIIDAKRNVWRVKLWSHRLPSGTFRRIIQFLEWNVKIFFWALRQRPKVVSCHCLAVIPLGVTIRMFTGSALIYEAHELETERNGWSYRKRRLAKLVERSFIHFVDHTIVVGPSIAKWYRDAYHIDSVSVVRNIPDTLHVPAARPTILRDTFKIPDDAMIFIYQGIIGHGRGIELLLDVFSEVKNSKKHVVFMGFGALVDHVREISSTALNIHYHPAVKPGDILSYSSSADVGLAIFENTSLSYFYSCPNKMFEYILSQVPPIVSDFPDMAGIVDEFHCGWKTNVDRKKIADLISSITWQDIEARRAGAAEARKHLSWQNEETVLQQIYRAFLGTI